MGVFRDGLPRADRPIRFKEQQRILQSTKVAPIKIDGRILVQGGGVWNDVDDITFDPLIPAGSLLVGAYTLLGRLF